MNLSIKWLNDYIDVSDIDIKKLCYDLTMTGSKVERYDVEGAEISKVVVGKLLSVVPHENSDHLVVCMVDVGADTPLQIVTGAPNVSAGDYVPVALDGSTLPGGVKIKKGKLRGVESNGMLCSLGELGLTTHDFPYAIEDGIFLLGDDCDLTLGKDIREAIGLNDTSVEFEITSNRPDCMSVRGLVREAHATFNREANLPEPTYKGVEGNVHDYLDVDVQNQKLCSRYIGGIVKNVKIGPSPRWMRERLRASGVRPINNFVDITNYVMLEYGHPMHAFDLRYVDGGKIVVRNAKEGEKITTLDGVERDLTEDMLIIADENKPVAVAGVMGGEYSGIMDDTTTVVFEAACFDGPTVRRDAKKLAMRTDASSRFEKGLDSRNCYPAIMRAFELVEQLGCGEVLNTIIDRDYGENKERSVPFDADWINGFLGTDIPESDMIKYLNSLDFEIRDGKAIAPYDRIDIECKADIAEEVARIYGYNNIPSTIITGVANAKRTPMQKLKANIKSAMIAQGFYEIQTYSFVSPKGLDKINLPEDSALRNPVVISNPLGEDTSVMRTSALPSLCEVMARNQNYRNMSGSIFEIATEYIKTDDVLPNELSRLVIGMYDAENGVDFFDLKGVVEEVLERIGISDYEVLRASESKCFDEKAAFHPGRSAVIIKDGTELAILGELHPDVLENYDMSVRCYAAKLNVDEALDLAKDEKVYKPLPKFPAATRDISFVCDEAIPVAELEKAIKKAVGKILEEVHLFDVYQGEQIEKGKKSVSYSITMRSHNETLTDEQADNAMKKVLKALVAMGAQLRG